MTQKVNYSGKRIDRLYIVEPMGRNNQGSPTWLCKCDCLNLCERSSQYLRASNTKQSSRACPECGRDKVLATNSNLKHGLSQHRLHGIWSKMKSRCHNKNTHNYKWYGAKGVKVCAEWRDDFKSFAEWAFSNGYQANLTIDRIDSSCGYSSGNCQWLTQSDNSKKARREAACR